MTARLGLPAALAAQILDEARGASPRECCGLIIGRRDGSSSQALALYAARNLATEADRFEIDPQDHFTALRTARAEGLAVIGCYHSHPKGVAQPSDIDRQGAGEEDFFWLIAAPGDGAWQTAAFLYRRGALVGADLVTSES